MSKRVSKDDIDRFHEYGLHLPTRTIYMGSVNYSEGEGGTDGLMAEQFIKNMAILDNVSDEPITILMNNIGGDEYHGLAMYDAIATSRSLVTIKVTGHAMSMGSIILQAADKRIMMPNARQMIHYGTWSAEGHAKTAQKWAQEGLKIDNWMESMYLKRIREMNPRYKMDDLKVLLDHDTFLTADESVELGLADKALKEKK